MAETYTVVWSGEKDAAFQKSRQRQPETQNAQPVKNPGSTGRVWHVEHGTAEDQKVLDMRANWQRRREQPIATAKLPRGEFVKT